MNNNPILTSFLDDDYYKFLMGQVVFHDFPSVVVTYRFFNRGGTKFPEGFAKALNHQLELMATLSLTVNEARFLSSQPGIRPTYVDWLCGYRLDPGEVVVTQQDGELSISIKGPWYRTIFWEVRLMAVISELYYRMTNVVHNDSAIDRMYDKSRALTAAGCTWIDFGTRRRFSYDIQHRLVRAMNQPKTGFMGTSNVHFSHMEGLLIPRGTTGHEMVMALAPLYGPKMANKMWAVHWSNQFHGQYGIALTDTFTTNVFLRDWDTYWARLFDGVRQDSGDPFEWGWYMINHYRKLGIDPSTKTFVFSDALTTKKFIELTETFRPYVKVVGGIGTHFTNDCGEHVTPLNMVIKMTEADFGNGPVPVVKLSDNAGKNTGDSDAINMVKKQLEIL